MNYFPRKLLQHFKTRFILYVIMFENVQSHRKFASDSSLVEGSDGQKRSWSLCQEKGQEGQRKEGKERKEGKRKIDSLF